MRFLRCLDGRVLLSCVDVLRCSNAPGAEALQSRTLMLCGAVFSQQERFVLGSDGSEVRAPRQLALVAPNPCVMLRWCDVQPAPSISDDIASRFSLAFAKQIEVLVTRLKQLLSSVPAAQQPASSAHHSAPVLMTKLLLKVCTTDDG